MQQPMDLTELRARYEIVRRSEYFPAILGAVAGGLTGALMAGLIAGSRRGSDDSGRGGQTPADRSGTMFGLSGRDLIQLISVVAALGRQVREWREQA
jgi:hypothetical protein